MTSSRLKVIVVGAGLGGLATGAFLREFADVTILESASELKEVGAAVSIGAGGNKILRSFDIHLEREGGIIPDKFTIWTMDGNMVEHPAPPVARFGDHLISIHRADLHAALLKAAQKPDGPGRPCQILLEHRVTTVDVEAGTVTAENGTTFSADVVIGADGIRSKIRSFISEAIPPQPYGESAYRLLIHAKDLPVDHSILANGKIAKTMHILQGHERKIVAYPIRGGDLVNIVALVPDSVLREEVSEKWTSKGSIELLVQAYPDVPPFWKSLLSSSKDVPGVWQLRDMDPLDTWIKGRTILVGDAAHPMLPYQAAGALSAIEDAEALYITLRDANRATVHESLQRAFRIRHKRASSCQAASRREGLTAPPNPHAVRDVSALWDYIGAERWEAERPEML